MMVLAYCADLDRMRENIDLLYDQGMYPSYLKRCKDLSGKIKTITKGVNSKTKVHHINNDTESLCYFEIDESDGFDFMRDVGLSVLAHGTNRGGADDPYEKVKNDPAALRIYEYFYPPIVPRDENGIQTGPAYFNKGVELARTPK